MLSITSKKLITTSCIVEIALHSSVGIGDSLHNLQLVIEFCTQRVPERLLHLTLNDLFHTHHDLKPNLLVFLAEMFYQFETVKPECVTGDGTYRSYGMSWGPFTLSVCFCVCVCDSFRLTLFSMELFTPSVGRKGQTSK